MRKQGRPEAALEEVRRDVAERPVEKAPAGKDDRGSWASLPEQPEDHVPEEPLMFHATPSEEEAPGEEQEPAEVLEEP